jgi:hypothetical protein
MFTPGRQSFEETPTHMSIKINRLEEGHNSYTLVCRRPAVLPFWILAIKETTDTASSASFLDLYLEFDDSGQLSTKIYDKRDDFNFKVINFPNMCRNIPDKTSSIYLYVKLKALASWIFLFFTRFWRNSDSYEYKHKSARRGAQFVHIGMQIQLRPHHFWIYTSKLMTVVNSVLRFMINGMTSILKS